jgi:hypothetical protein
MRKARLSSILCLQLTALPALAQNIAPADVKLDEPTPAQAPAALAAKPAVPAAKPAAPSAAAAAAPTAEAQEKAKKAEDTRAASGSVSGPATESDDSWKFGYNGFFRAPMRIGIATRTPMAGQSSTTMHSPLVPDDQYLSWQHTKHANRDWAELFLSYGNSWAKGVVAIQGYNFTDSSYADASSNFGIGQGWIEITPYMPLANIRFKMKAGSFWNRYGAAGRYDAGEYDTHVIGRTHVMGETSRLEIDIEGQPMTLGFEHGIGTKKPDPSIYNTSRFTLLHHMHVDMVYDQSISFGLHFLDSWSQSEPLVTGPQQSWVYQSPYASRFQGINQPDGSMKIFGAEARFDMPDVFGYFYLGGSYIKAQDAVTVAPAVEVIHSDGGGEYNMGVTGNYLDSNECRWAANASAGVHCSNGTGSILSLMGQYEQKLGDLLGESPFGEGQDLTMKFYGMWNKVKSDDASADGNSKLKFGTDMSFDVFPVMAVAARFDYLMPNTRYKQQNFGILSPRIVLRSSFVTHEQISFQYSRYLYAKRTCDVGTPADNPLAGIADSKVGTPFPNANGQYSYGATPTHWEDEAKCVQPPPSTVAPDGWGSTTQSQTGQVRGMPYTGSSLRPDVNVVAIEASMWW